MHTVDYAVVLVYLIIMILIGVKTSSSSKNISDYLRMGNKSTWWMAGFSLFMASFSAATFTGIAGQAFIAGWSVLWVPIGSACVFFIQAAFMAPILRRTRAITPMDAVRSRFGPLAEQVKSYVSVLSSFFFAGFFLLGFGTFASSLLGIPLWVIVVVMGVVVVFYSVSGGSWSVQITDSLQALILIPVTLGFMFICLHEIGGFSGLFESIRAAGLTEDFALVKAADHEYITDLPFREGNFTWLWLAGSILGTIMLSVSISTCHRYLSLKDEVSSQKAALLAGCLMLLGCLIWFIPPIVGRLLFLDDVIAVEGIPNPADAAYTITAMKLLPPGLLGLIFVCMLSATMSSMDGFLTGTAGFIVRNLYQPFIHGLSRLAPDESVSDKGVMGFLIYKVYRPFMHLLKRPEESDQGLLSLTRYVNLTLGLWAIVMAFVLNRVGGDTGMFEVMQTILTLIGAPTGIPFALSLFLKRIPLWGLFAGIGCGIGVSITMLSLREFYDYKVQWGYETMIMTTACVLPTIISTLFWKHTNREFKDRVDKFFVMINTPVNVKDEVGASADSELLRTVGTYALAMGLLVLPLVIWGESPAQIYVVVGISAFMMSVGGFMYHRSRKANTDNF